MFKDYYTYVRKCKNYQTTSGKGKRMALPLQPVEVEGPFKQSGFDIIGDINPNSSKLHKYILTSTNYFTS